MKKITRRGVGRFLNQEIGSKKIDQRIISLFLKQLSLLLGSSTSIDDGLEIIKNQKIDRKLSKTLSSIIFDLKNGFGVSEAFDKKSKEFGNITLAFIKSGDKSGKLSEILDDLSNHITEEYEKKSQIKQAFIYPIILLIVTILVVIAMMVFVLPTFLSVFEGSGQSLPFSTRILISISDFMINYGKFILLFLTLTFLIIILLRKNPSIGFKIDRIIFKNILFKDFRKLSMEYQFSSLFGILRKADVDIIETMQIIKNSYKNQYIRKRIDGIIRELGVGTNISDAFRNSDIFSNLIISMIKVGEDSGNMIEAMEKTSTYLSNEYLYRLKKISQMVEPVLIILMALIVGFVVFSVAIPMFDTVNNINI